MENFERIEEKIQNMKDEKIIKVKSSPFGSIIVIIAGILIAILGLTIFKGASLTPLLVVTGAVIIIVGVIYLVMKTSKNSGDYIYEPTGGKLKKYKIYIDTSNARKMISCITNKDFNGVKTIKKTMDSGCLMEIRGTDDGSIFLFQLLEYIPHDFVPSSPVIVLHGEDAKIMLDFVKS
ncbi:MAG: hypothetical protein LBL13_12690 [Bacteroidales bacterium]|jgi:hypothetical protein|nr:hypothetical protein [Bacteroidales bacterium]